MENVKEQYTKTCERRIAVVEHLNELTKNPLVQRFIQLNAENKGLILKMEKLYLDMKLEEYESCNHVGVLCEVEYDRYEGRTYRTYGCIKCGLNQAMASGERQFLTEEEKAMIKYFKKHRYMNFQEIKNVGCDLELATAITRQIREVHLDISDEDLIQYFKNSLEHIREIPVNEQRKEARIQRLSLKPKFKNWQERDIES